MFHVGANELFLEDTEKHYWQKGRLAESWDAFLIGPLSFFLSQIFVRSMLTFNSATCVCTLKKYVLFLNVLGGRSEFGPPKLLQNFGFVRSSVFHCDLLSVESFEETKAGPRDLRSIACNGLWRGECARLCYQLAARMSLDVDDPQQRESKKSRGYILEGVFIFPNRNLCIIAWIFSN